MRRSSVVHLPEAGRTASYPDWARLVASAGSSGACAGIALVSGAWLIAQYAFDDPVSSVLLGAFEVGFWLGGALLVVCLATTGVLARRAVASPTSRARVVIVVGGTAALGLVAGISLVLAMSALNDAGTI
ncbi:hypothetical protein [Actinomyces howellii]|uniref:Uncharacterized protein n=1 Tax=Actinomyces howellii TaxID=52771 RepID=A0A448HFB0_9ACTO|nr:hypothetical protein [Actinomyces howellii]VEG26990.1 Uncharacterised protein [Actinomyces howellii]